MKKLLKHWQFWLAVFIILLGAFIFSFGIYYTVTDRAKLKNYTEMTAVVVDYEERRSHNSDNHHTTYTYAEVVEYSVNGVTYKAVNNASSTSPKKLGSAMKIAINPDDPSDCVFVNSQKWTYVFLFVFGAAIVVFGSVLMGYLVKNL